MRIRLSLLFVAVTVLVLAACQPATPVATPTPSASPVVTRTPSASPSATAPAKSLPKLQAQINGFLKPYGADGADWPPNVDVTIQVYDQPQGKVLFTGTSTTDGNGHFFQDVDLATRPGMVVVVTDGRATLSVVLVPLAINAIDLSTDTVTGTALPGAAVVVYIGDNSQNAVLETTASAAGQWQADFAGRFDITEAATVQAVVRDADGHGTAYKTAVK